MILGNQNIESDNDSNNCKYYGIDKFIQGEFVENNYFSILHQNIHSVQAHIEEFKLMMKCMQFNFDIIAFSESKLQKGINPVVNINIPNYSYEHTLLKLQKVEP